MTFADFNPALLYRWALIDDKTQLISNSLKGTAMENPKINAGLGFFYLDPLTGSSLHLEQALILEDTHPIEKIDIDPEKGGFFVFRHSVFKSFSFQTLTLEEENEWNLPPSPVGLSVPPVPLVVKNMLKDTFFDPFRAPSHPNNVMFSLGSEGKEVETVWGAFLEPLPQDNLYALMLLNEPHQDFGVHEGDILPVMYQADAKGDLLVWMPQFGTLNTEIV